jgi:hypothetical protein
MKRFLAVVIALAVGAVGWYYVSNRTALTPISELHADPGAYEATTLVIEGVVTDRAALFGLKYYDLRDESGDIKVITERILRQIGDRVRVEGHIEEAFALGDFQYLVFIEESVEER